MRAFYFFGCLSLLLAPACTEPIEPSFQLEEPFYLVEGRIADTPGRSQIAVRRSEFRSATLDFEPIVDATVITIDGAGRQVLWALVDSLSGRYGPPADFATRRGEQWSVTLTLPDGTQIFSAPEEVPAPTVLHNLDLVFDRNASFDTGLGQFIPGFKLFTEFTDPAGENYYQWDYRYWEIINICASCYNGEFWRAGACRDLGGPPFVDRYDYLCDAPDECYQERVGNEFRVSRDDSFDGRRVAGLQIGEIELRRFGGLLVEGIQYGTSAEAFAYGKVVSDLVNGNSGLNATTPATLGGNLRNGDPAGPPVLGFVGAVSVATTRTYVLRTTQMGEPVRPIPSIQLEPAGLVPPPFAYCRGNGKSPVKPAGWPD